MGGVLHWYNYSMILWLPINLSTWEKKVTNAMIHDHLTVKKKTLIEKDKGQRLGGYAT